MAEAVITASGNWVCPEGVRVIQIEAWGGGGGGRNGGGNPSSGDTSTGGGGGGAYSKLSSFNVTPGQSYPVVIGAGGGVGGDWDSAGDGLPGGGVSSRGRSRSARNRFPL